MNGNQEQIFSLLELNAAIRSVVESSFPERYWVCAEISELHLNNTGHCYLELIEKDNRSRTIARSRAMIWASTYMLLQPYFEQETGQRLTSGIKVLVQVSVACHELYGISLTIHDINPGYTLGEAARKRSEILARLKDEGVLDMNKELPIPLLPQRIAIISSGTAAGYGDFINQLTNNSHHYSFYPVLFAAVMQGERTEASVIEALNRIYSHIEYFDCVVIIRGGGATSDLGCFDSYPIAANIAQFPLPVIVGIGHERDETVLDDIAAIRVKTPTAAAEWLINRAREAELSALALQQQIIDTVENKLLNETHRLQQLAHAIPMTITTRLHREAVRQQQMTHTIDRNIHERISRESNRLSLITHLIPERIETLIRQERQKIDNMEHTVRLLSPDAVLSRGYSLILHNGKAIQSIENISAGNDVKILLADGSADALITQTIKNKPYE